jgi:hypothetical protein
VGGADLMKSQADIWNCTSSPVDAALAGVSAPGAAQSLNPTSYQLSAINRSNAKELDIFRRLA